MNTAVASSSGNNAAAQNIGFAIPESNLQTLLPQLRQGGVRSSNAYLGVEIQDLTPQLRQSYGFVPTSGALVDSVVSGSPADGAGIQTGDVIVGYDGKVIATAQDLHVRRPGFQTGAEGHDQALAWIREAHGVGHPHLATGDLSVAAAGRLGVNPSSDGSQWAPAWRRRGCTTRCPTRRRRPRAAWRGRTTSRRSDSRALPWPGVCGRERRSRRRRW